MKIKKEQEEQIINFGAFDYDAKKIANILNLEIKIVEAELKNKNSELSLLWQKGKDMADYVIDLKLFDQAKNGDVKSLNKLEERKWKRNKNKEIND